MYRLRKGMNIHPPNSWRHKSCEKKKNFLRELKFLINCFLFFLQILPQKCLKNDKNGTKDLRKFSTHASFSTQRYESHFQPQSAVKMQNRQSLKAQW